MAVGFRHVEHRCLDVAATGGAHHTGVYQGVYTGGAPQRRHPVLAAGGKEGRRRLSQSYICRFPVTRGSPAQARGGRDPLRGGACEEN